MNVNSHNKYSLSTYCLANAVLHAENAPANKTDKVPVFEELTLGRKMG